MVSGAASHVFLRYTLRLYSEGKWGGQGRRYHGPYSLGVPSLEGTGKSAWKVHKVRPLH